MHHGRRLTYTEIDTNTGRRPHGGAAVARTRRRPFTRFEKILLGTVAVLLGALLLVFAGVLPLRAQAETKSGAETPGTPQTAVPPGTDPEADAPVSVRPAANVSQPSLGPAPEDLDVSAISLAGRRIIVDAGHGGSDHGCTGVSGRLEKEVNLEIAKVLQSRLEEEGVTVIMTRETDDAIAPTKEEDMAERARIIRDSHADAFVSIHQNQFPEDSTVCGPQVFYAYQGTAGKKLAVAVQEMLNGRLEFESPRMALDVPYDLLQPGEQPSCTVECGFFSNPEEEALLQTPEYQKTLAICITDGIKLYFKRTGA